MNNLEEIKNGNMDAFNSLIKSVQTKMYKTAMAILKNDDDACDAIQEALISIYKNINSLQKEEYFTTWVIRIVINKCYDLIKKNKKVTYLNEKMQINEELDSYYDIYAEESSLENVLNLIDPDLKIVTVLYYYDELPINEISEILNIPEGTVKSRLSRSREKLYAILKEKEGEHIG